MAQAYTSPDWASGEGISPSNLQSISNVLEGIVQGSDKAIHNIEINGSNLVATYVDGTTETFPVVGVKGIAEVTKSSRGNVDTYTMIFTDGTTYSFTVTNGGGGGSASGVSYNNTITQIAATNVQDAIDSVFTSVSNGKELVASAITDKGIPTLATDTFAIMAEHIAEIEGGGSGIDISLNANWYTNLSDCVDNGFQKFRLSSETTHLVEYDSSTRELVILEDSIAMFSYENDHSSSNVAEMNIYINGISTEIFNIPLNSYIFRLYKFSAGDRIKVYKGSGGWSCIASCFIKKPSGGSGGTDVSDTTAIESDVAIGKIFHKADGSRAVGTYEAPKVVSGQIRLSTSASTNIECGFKPKVVNILMGSSYTAVGGVQLDYVESISTAQQWVSGNSNALPTTTNNRIGSINENGFTLTKVSDTRYSYCTYYAIG